MLLLVPEPEHFFPDDRGQLSVRVHRGFRVVPIKWGQRSCNRNHCISPVG
jgi:hypothetical protein